VKKHFDPPVPKAKTEKGDYIVGKFVIPDRVVEKKVKVEGDTSSDEEEEEEEEEV